MEPNTTTDLSPVVDEQVLRFFSWSTASGLLQITGFVISVLGVIGNFLCYVTAEQLAPTNSAFFMKHLAICDTISELTVGVDLIARRLQIYIININVWWFPFCENLVNSRKYQKPLS